MKSLVDCTITCNFSGVLFLALKAVAKMPWQFYCDNTRSELFMKTDPRFGLEMDKDELDKDETKIIHLFNLVTHESEIPSLERTKTAVRSIILLESLKQSDYFKVNFEGPFLFVQNNG